MSFFKKMQSPISHRLKNLFAKDYSLQFLNGTQFTVVLIDNIFKLIVAFFLIDKIGKDKASQILSFVGAIYVIPFLLFSSTGGVLADRFSKQRITIGIKIFEVIIILFSFIAFKTKSAFGAYTVLFLLSVQSAVFGPSKYGIIADLVSKDQVAKGNGLITSFTYLAIISGTFLGSFLTEITHHHYVIISGITLLFSLVGLFFAFKIRYTEPRGSKKKINLLFINEIYQTLQYAKTLPHVLLALFSAAYFLFIGAYMQLSIIPYAIAEMKLPEVAGGYLFLTTALGIAIGAVFAGKVCKKGVNLLLPLIGGIGLAILFILLKFSASSIPLTVLILVLTGISGGMFIVPFETYAQISSSDEKRGQVIGAANFLGFIGVLLASCALYIFSEVFGIKASSGFFIVGLMTLSYCFLLILRLSDFLLPYLSRYLLNIFTTYSLQNDKLIQDKTILVTTSHSLKRLSLLSHPYKKAYFIMDADKLQKASLFFRSMNSFIGVPASTTMQERVDLAKKLQGPHTLCCLVIEDNFKLYDLQKKGSWKHFFSGKGDHYVYVEFQRTPSNDWILNFSEVK